MGFYPLLKMFENIHIYDGFDVMGQFQTPTGDKKGDKKPEKG